MDCGDSSCLFAEARTGMRTNGGCRCLEKFEVYNPEENKWNRKDVEELRTCVLKLRQERNEARGELSALLTTLDVSGFAVRQGLDDTFKRGAEVMRKACIEYVRENTDNWSLEDGIQGLSVPDRS